MINADMRKYDYFTYGDLDSYGQPKLSEKQGQIKMNINITSQSIQDNINYSNCSYIGLTQESVNDNYVIQYNDERLKVGDGNPKGRYKQVFMERM